MALWLYSEKDKSEKGEKVLKTKKKNLSMENAISLKLTNQLKVCLKFENGNRMTALKSHWPGLHLSALILSSLTFFTLMMLISTINLAHTSMKRVCACFIQWEFIVKMPPWELVTVFFHYFLTFFIAERINQLMEEKIMIIKKIIRCRANAIYLWWV